MRALAIWATLTASAAAQPALRSLAIDYPPEGAVFPPDFAAPTFLWRDPAAAVDRWRIDVIFADSAPPLRVETAAAPLEIGPIDPRAAGPTNEIPRLTAEQARARAWKPEPAFWRTLKSRSQAASATITISGLRGGAPVSSGRVSIRTSADPVGAPVFYRDVPLMPSELKKGEIKPISPRLLPYVRWSLRDVGEPASRTIMEGVHTCANCHSFSRDGKTLAMDLDGPQNDKGLYAILPLRPRASITKDEVISWRVFRNQRKSADRIGFMSQISPDGRYVMTATQVEYYVANFKDYRFLQVFYPTRGILAFYDRQTRRMRALPGADDPRYVQANPVWSPGGDWLVFARAAAQPAYPEGAKPAEYANDPNEPRIQYDLYRIPFNGGQGGRPIPIAGASRNGMSNSFPKVSPDGRWIVYVQSRNGQLMRPDGQLYIVAAAGGEARRMKCNTPLMNSWHSFSPNGRWMVFSSKARSPYTQMFLTHIDQDGNDTPPILIENATAANRAVNIPEFVNIPPGGLLSIDAPAAEFYRLYDAAWDLTEKGETSAAIDAWNRALALDPADPKALTNLAALLLRNGDLAGAAARLRSAVAADPDFVDARNNLGIALLQAGKPAEAAAEFRKALAIDPESAKAHANLGSALVASGDFAGAKAAWRHALALEPDGAAVLSNLAWLLATCPDGPTRNGAEAVAYAERALQRARESDPAALDVLAAAYAEAGRFADAVKTARHAVMLATDRRDGRLAADIVSRLALYETNRPFHERR
jgi:tetratricopeptide (TPR) repeat protein